MDNALAYSILAPISQRGTPAERSQPVAGHADEPTRRCLQPQRRAQARQARPNAPEGEMLMPPKHTLKTRRALPVGGKTYRYYSLEAAAAEPGDISRPPYSMKVLLANLPPLPARTSATPAHP